MKKSRIIAPAAAILVFSSAAAVTGTVAWFTASNLVSVSGMYMKAAAENGIVIAPETESTKVATDWKTSAIAKHSGDGAEFYPTSTKDKSAWYHGSSQKQDDGQYAVAYDQITVEDIFESTDPSDGDEQLGIEGDGIYGYRAEDKTFRNVYLLNKFYIQASATADLGSNDRDIYIRDFKVVVKDSNPAAGSTQDLNKSLRMLVTYKKSGGAETFSKIIAPIEGATEKYYVNKSFADFSNKNTYSVGSYVIYSGTKYICETAVTTAGDWATVGDNFAPLDLDDDRDVDAVTYGEMHTAETTGDETGVSLLERVTIPGYTEAGTNAIEFSFYLYFEGEDTNHKSSNLEDTMDQLAISFNLGNKVSATQNP